MTMTLTFYLHFSISEHDLDLHINIISRGNDHDLGLLKSELERRVAEAEEQRQEMGRMAERWGQEVRSIQETHNQERRELQEVIEGGSAQNSTLYTVENSTLCCEHNSTLNCEHNSTQYKAHTIALYSKYLILNG